MQKRSLGEDGAARSASVADGVLEIASGFGFGSWFNAFGPLGSDLPRGR
jgi:hypothetical protein